MVMAATQAGYMGLGRAVVHTVVGQLQASANETTIGYYHHFNPKTDPV